MVWITINAINVYNYQYLIPQNTSMEFGQLRQFLAVAETLHFGQAAERLGMAQPHLSRAIRKLETEVGARLFLRTSRKVQLTHAGEVLREEALDLIHGEQRAAALTRQATQENAAALRIAFVSAALYHLLPGMLRQLRAIRPGARIELREASTEEQMELLSRGDIDLGLGHLPVVTRGRIIREVLVKDRFDALLPADHRMAGQPVITFGQLSANPFVLFPEEQGPALYAAIRDQCRLVGRSLQVAETASRLHSQCALVAAGLGVGIAPTQSQSLSVAGTVRVPIKPYPPTLELALALFRDGRRSSPLLDECVSLLRLLGQVGR